MRATSYATSPSRASPQSPYSGSPFGLCGSVERDRLALVPSCGPSSLVAIRLNMLTAIDVQFGAGDIARLIRAQIIDRFRDFLRHAETAQRERLDQLFGARREDRGIDLARRDRIDAHTQRTKIGRHLACERRERRF